MSFLSGCAATTKSYARIYQLQHVALVSCNANPTVEAFLEKDEAKGFSFGDIQSGIKTLSALSDGKSLREALDSAGHHTRGVNTQVANQIMKIAASSKLFGLIPQNKVLNHPAYQAYEAKSRGSKPFEAPENWRVYTNYDISPDCRLASQIGADALLITTNQYFWQRKQIVANLVTGKVIATAYLVTPTGEVLWSGTRNEESRRDIHMVNGAYDWGAMNILLAEAAEKAYADLFGHLKDEVLYAAKATGLPIRSDSVWNLQNQALSDSVSDSTVAPAVDSIGRVDSVGIAAETVDSSTLHRDSSFDATASALQTPDSGSLTLVAQDSTVKPVVMAPAMAEKQSIQPVDSTSAEKTSKGVLFCHPVTLFKGKGIEGLIFPYGIWFTYELKQTRSQTMVLRAGFLMKESSLFESDSLRDVFKESNGMRMQLGYRHYGSKAFQGWFYEIMGTLQTMDLNFENQVQGVFKDNFRTSALVLGGMGFVGWAKTKGRLHWYYNAGLGYAYSMYNDRSFYLSNDDREKHFTLNPWASLIDLNFGIGLAIP